MLEPLSEGLLDEVSGALEEWMLELTGLAGQEATELAAGLFHKAGDACGTAEVGALILTGDRGG